MRPQARQNIDRGHEFSQQIQQVVVYDLNLNFSAIDNPNGTNLSKESKFKYFHCIPKMIKETRNLQQSRQMVVVSLFSEVSLGK